MRFKSVTFRSGSGREGNYKPGNEWFSHANHAWRYASSPLEDFTKRSEIHAFRKKNHFIRRLYSIPFHNYFSQSHVFHLCENKQRYFRS